MQEIDGIPTKTTIAADKASAVYGTPITFTIEVAPLSGSGTPSGVVFFGPTDSSVTDVSLDAAAGHATYTTSTIDVGAHTMRGLYSGDTNFAESTGSTQVTIAAIGPADSPTISPGSGTYTAPQSVSLTSSQLGNQIFYTTDGTTPTQSSTIYFEPILVNRSETIKAVAIATGYALSPVASANYTINLPPPDFTLSVAPAAVTEVQGEPATTAVTVTSVNGFTQSVSLGCSGLPTGFACSFSPATLNPSTAGALSSLTITNTATAENMNEPAHYRFAGLATVALGMILIPFVRKDLIVQSISLLVISVCFVTLAGCGSAGNSSGSSSATPPTVSTITITATSGSLQHTATLSFSH